MLRRPHQGHAFADLATHDETLVSPLDRSSKERHMLSDCDRIVLADRRVSGARFQALTQPLSWHDDDRSERTTIPRHHRGASPGIGMAGMSVIKGDAATCSDGWTDVPRMFRDTDDPLPPPWQELFGPLRHGRVDGLVVVGQFGQSLDARIATVSGDSRYINGAAGLAHLHRLRALVDAVLVGVGTAQIDDPQLTVRRVSGPSPARVIVDPSGRLPATARVLAADGIARLVITRQGAASTLPHGVEIARLP